MNEGKGATKALREELYMSQGTAQKMAEILEGGYFDLADGAQVALNEMAWGQDVVTKKSAKEMVATYNDMNNQIIDGLKNKNAQEIEQANNNFRNLKGLSDE